MARLQAPRGTEDLLPERIPALDFVFETCREVFGRYGYREIRTPLFEETSLFVRSLGEVTDVVEKEMFTVARGETNVTFRPEGTAPVVRAYLEHNLDKVRAFQKFFYMGPMFRFERPQAGRSRQFHQVGVEALGSASPLLDAEVILLAHRCFQALGLANYRVHLNTIGDAADRERFRAVLKAYFTPLMAQRCADCQQRLQRNVFRMLDCKVAGCQPSNRAAPHFLDHVSAATRARFDQSVAILAGLDVPHAVDPAIVRGFDYYTHTVFEVRCHDLGARDTVCGGGRYDGLIEDLGGPALGAVGFAIGVTPTLLALEKQGHPAMRPAERGVPILVAPVGAADREAAFLLTERLRAAGLAADTDYEDKSLKAIFKAADKRGVRLVVMLGGDERARGAVKVKDLQSGAEVELPDDAALAAGLRSRLAPAAP
ncbi:MAG: histidine--tRNA ligase [Planctomycetes bacterium]|nr:histidine--tRNA ligase [Planctomycetota bacterium]